MIIIKVGLMTIGVNYSVVRFRPNRILDEFANIGVVSIDVSNGHVCYAIAADAIDKIRRFFPSCDKVLIVEAINIVVGDLSRLTKMSTHNNHNNMISAFNHAVSVREGIVFFSDKRSAITELDLISYTKKLCDEYVDNK